MQTPNPSGHQLETLQLYGALIGIREDWGGRLVLCCGEGCAMSGIPAAVGIAGGGTLAIDPDAAALKAVMRAGELDFVVNTLDEALRTLKNEVRRRHPLSVGLIADMNAVLGEIVERGVLPQLLLVGMNQPSRVVLQNESIQALQVEEMPVQVMADSNDERLANPMVILSGKRYRGVYLPAANVAALKNIDESVQAILPAGEQLRRRWIQRVPQYLREARSGGRWVWLSDEEREQLAANGLFGKGE